MGLFDSPEEKATKQAAREQEEREAQQQLAAQRSEQQRQAFLATPLGQATQAKQQNLAFLEIQLTVGQSQREAMWGSADARVSDQRTSAADTLGKIEELGWRLEHVGYVFMMTGQSSTDKVFLSGENTSISGQLVGIYLFRNTDHPMPPTT